MRMKTRTFTPMGSLHPILFFVVVYVVALMLSIFICSSLFYTFNSSSEKIGNVEKSQQQMPGSTVVAASTVALHR